VTLSLEHLVDPDEYDADLYNLLHQVLDRTIELAAKADTSEDTDGAAEGDPGSPDGFVDILRSQANFTPAEKAEFQATGTVLNLLINVAVSRRSGLYHQPPEEREP
jgi:hypothetical protein